MSIKLNPQTFCVFPFYQTVVRTNGVISPCCEMRGFNNINHIDIQQEWRSQSRQSIKAQMLEGRDRISACESCYRKEAKFGQSPRTRCLQDYKFFSPKHYDSVFGHMNLDSLDFPKRVEIHVGNLCNLKCLTCRPRDSSSFLTEDVILGISNLRQSDFQIDDQILLGNLDMVLKNHLDILDLRGGESMLHPLIKKFLLDTPAHNFPEILRIQTNCTILDEQWKTIFEKFRTVEIMASIDAFDSDNHYIRYPADWSTIESTIDYFKCCKQVKLYVNCTVSNLNFLVLNKLIAWCRQKQIYIHFAMLESPAHFQFNNLPPALFEQAKQRLIELDDGIAGMIQSSQADNQLWSQFCQTISMRDRHRKNSIFDMLPQLRPHWNS